MASHIRTLLGVCARREAAASGAVILVYHGVKQAPLDPDLDTYCQSSTDFASHLRFLGQRRKVVPLAQLVEAVASGAEPDRDWVVLTLDDALRCQADLAASILSDHHLPWALGVPAGNVTSGRPVWTYELDLLIHRCWRRTTICLPGSGMAPFPTNSPVARQKAAASLKAWMMAKMTPRQRLQQLDDWIEACGRHEFRERMQEHSTIAMASWSEVRRLAQAGVEILSHGWDHAQHTAALPDEGLLCEVRESHARIQSETGQAPRGFVLPGGVRDARSQKVIAEAGYQYCLTTENGRVGRHARLLDLPRIDAEYPLSVLRWHMLAPVTGTPSA